MEVLGGRAATPPRQLNQTHFQCRLDHLRQLGFKKLHGPPLVRKTPEGPQTRLGGWFRRTKGGGRPARVLSGPTGPILAEIHQPSDPRGLRTLAMVQGATPHAAFRTNTFQIDDCKSNMKSGRQ